MTTTDNGFLIFPYTNTDWAIITVALSATIFKILLLYYNEPKVKVRDWLSVVVIAYIASIGLYEAALARDWDLGLFFIPFSLSIVMSKDIADWLFLEEDGKKFIIETFKIVVKKLIDIKIK